MKSKWFKNVETGLEFHIANASLITRLNDNKGFEEIKDPKKKKKED